MANSVLGGSVENTFQPEAIYNSVYEERALKREEKNAKLLGEWFRSEKSGTIVGHNKGDGLYFRILSSNKQLEEDLALMYGTDNESDTFLTTEEHREAINTALASILKDYGRFFRPQDIQEIFPGVSLDDLDGYDFSRTRVRFFVLGSSDCDVFLSLADGRKTNGWRMPVGANIQAIKADDAKYFKHPWIGAPYVTPIVSEDEIGIVVIRENIWGDNREKRVEESSTWSDRDLKGHIARVKKEVEETVRHEILHTLHVGYGFNHKIMEGITSYYAEYPADYEEYSGPSTELDILEKLGDLETNVFLVSDVVNLCAVMGMTEEAIHMALLAADSSALAMMNWELQITLGSRFATDFMMYGFSDIDRAEETIFNYLQKLDSTKNPPLAP